MSKNPSRPNIVHHLIYGQLVPVTVPPLCADLERIQLTADPEATWAYQVDPDADVLLARRRDQWTR
jgi:hypothetical protein